MSERRTFTIRIDEPLLSEARAVAAADGRKVNNWLLRVIREAIDGRCPSCGRTSGVPAPGSPILQLVEERAREELEERRIQRASQARAVAKLRRMDWAGAI